MFHVKQRSAVLTYPESQELPLTRKIVVRAAGFVSPGDGNCAKPLTPVGRGGAAAPLPPFFSPPARGRGRKDGASKLLSGLTSGRAPCRMARSFPLLCCHPGLVPGSRPSGTAPEHSSTGHDRSRLSPERSPSPRPSPPRGRGGFAAPLRPLLLPSRLREGPGEGRSVGTDRRDPVRSENAVTRLPPDRSPGQAWTPEQVRGDNGGRGLEPGVRRARASRPRPSPSCPDLFRGPVKPLRRSNSWLWTPEQVRGDSLGVGNDAGSPGPDWRG